MTAIYLGNGNWELHFNDRKRVVLSEHEIQELSEQADEILYGEEHHVTTKILETYEQSTTSDKNKSNT